MGDEGFSRLEIALKDGFIDAVGNNIKKKARDYFGIEIESVRSVRVLTSDSETDPEKKRFLQDILTDPVTEVSSYEPLFKNIDNALWIGWKPGVKDNTGDVTKEMFTERYPEDLTNFFSSNYFVLQEKQGTELTQEQIDILGKEFSNFIVQNYRIFSSKDWVADGIGENIPRIGKPHVPGIETLKLSDLTFEGIKRLSDERNLYLNPNDIPTIVDFFTRDEFIRKRMEKGMEGPPTDIELEYTSQARSDHCNHNTFNGLFRYRELGSDDMTIINNMFKECIVEPTRKLAEERPWVKSILWDNAGIAEFNERYLYVVTGETHNSPSNMEAYGGAITGIVGIYRDPMGTGRGSKLVAGAYGYCVGPRDYDGEFVPLLHPRQLQDGIILGVRDGGNKSGIPTIFGSYFEEPESMGKSLVFVYAMGLMPKETAGTPTYEKYVNPGDLIVMSGGLVGKDGIHGVTASSAGLDKDTPAQHVQIGDPYTQKKMHDFLIEARDEGYINFITDNGGGGLSSSIGEASRMKNTSGRTGAKVYLDRVPLKYEGLDQWEIWVSESQERMTVGVSPDNILDFLRLSEKHGVISTVIGEFTNDDRLEILYDYKTNAYIPSEFLAESFPQWEFDAVWVKPEDRGLKEPEIKYESPDLTDVFKKFLARPNIASKEWIARQYDHEVQGTSIIKPLVGLNNDIPSDAVVIRPDLYSEKGIAMTQSIKQKYSKIDAYDMVAAVIDESVRSILAVGGKLEHLTGIDNFCWPTIIPRENNPDAELNAAHLVRANWALRDFQYIYGIPLLSGKDSMYTDGDLENKLTGEKKRMYGLPTMQFTLHSIVDDVMDCISCDAKEAGNLIYVIGETRDELGGSEFYSMNSYTGVNVPKTDAEENILIYRQFEKARRYCESVKVVKDGIGVSVFQMALGGGLGADIDLGLLETDSSVKDEYVSLFSESTGRFVVEVKKENCEEFERMMDDNVSLIGYFTESPIYEVYGFDGNLVIAGNMSDFEKTWKGTHGDR